MRFIAGIAMLLLMFFSGYPGLAASPRTEELVGQWVSQVWATDLEQGHSPLGAASGKNPQAFTLKPMAGGGFRLNLTTFHESTWRAVRVLGASKQEAVFEMGPLEQEHPSADIAWEQVPVKIDRDGDGNIVSLTAVLWPGDSEAVRYCRLPMPVQDWALRVVFGEKNGEAPGQWVRKTLGMMVSDSEFRLNLAPSESCCDWLHVGGDKIGFSWQGEELRFYRMVQEPEGCPLACAKGPFMVLRPRQDVVQPGSM